MKIDVKGVIVPNDQKEIYDMFGIDSTSPKSISESLKTADGDIEVVVNSGGGDVASASQMYFELKEHPGNVDVKISGIAASAASIISMAGDKVKMSPTSQLMIHNASTAVRGDHRDMQSASEMLKSVNESAVNAYKIKTGIEEEKLTELMNAETWLSPKQAVEMGFVDEIMFEESHQAVAYTDGMIPQQVIDGVRNMALKQESTTSKESGGFSDDEKKEIRRIVKEEVKKQSEEKANNQQTQPVQNNWLF